MYAIVDKLARFFAIIGGIVLSILIVMTCLSIVGRSLNSILHSGVVQSLIPELASQLLAAGVGPINGDFELVEAGMAFSIFAFLPLCQLNSAHASVDILTSRLSDRVNRFLALATAAIFAAVLILIAVQLYGGMQSKHRSGQTTFLLQYPLWWAYAASLLGAVVTALVSVYVLYARFIEAVTGRIVLPAEEGAEH